MITNKENKKIRTTIKIPSAVRKAMLTKVVEDGYGLRGKSRWISEAIESLLEMDNFYEYVKIANEMTELTDTDIVQLSLEMKKKLEQALIKVRQHYPSLEGVQSCIIRSSIIQRLLRT